MKKLILSLILSGMILISSPASHAGILVDFDPLGSDVILIGGFLNALNNDNANNANLGPILDAQATPFNWVAIGKNFPTLNPIDISLTVAPTGGTTEYFFVEVVRNSTGFNWSDYHLELGTGSGSSFVPLSNLGAANLGLDFDTPDQDPAVESLFLGGGPIFSVVQHQSDAIRLQGGVIPISAPGAGIEDLAFITYSLDVPDLAGSDIYTFTLRQYPSVVPEPTSMLLLGGGLLGAFMRRKKSTTSV
jgi:hypothetical protein